MNSLPLYRIFKASGRWLSGRIIVMKKFLTVFVLISFFSNICFAMPPSNRRGRGRNPQPAVQRPIEEEEDDPPPYNDQMREVYLGLAGIPGGPPIPEAFEIHGEYPMPGDDENPDAPLMHIADRIPGAPPMLVADENLGGLQRPINGNQVPELAAPPLNSCFRALAKNLGPNFFIGVRKFGTVSLAFFGYKNFVARGNRNVARELYKFTECAALVKEFHNIGNRTLMYNPQNWINFLTLLDEFSFLLNWASQTIDVRRHLTNLSLRIQGQPYLPAVEQPRLIDPIWRQRLNLSHLFFSLCAVGWDLHYSDDDSLRDIAYRDAVITIFSLFVVMTDRGIPVAEPAPPVLPNI